MLEINRIDWGDTSAAGDLDALRATLGMGGGQTTQESMRRTIEVFGEPLSPASVVKRILDEVRIRGDLAVASYTAKLDGIPVVPGQFAVSRDELQAAFDGIDADFRAAILAARENIERFQRHILSRPPEQFTRDGVRIDTVYRPLRRVGVYIPGGGAPYPSAVLMDVIPAQVAGCREIVVTTSPRHLNAHVLAALHLLGVTEVYRIGGAQAVGMLAYGTESVKPVDMIVGAGNLYVNLAKREVAGTVKIDMFAGPSEVLVIADEKANPDFIAADMLSQAEHYPGSAMLVATSQRLVDEVEAAIERQLSDMPRAAMCREMLAKYGAVIQVDTLDEAVEVANRVAPEHLEIMTADPRALAVRIENAGTVFLGASTPEAAGDYVAGPSHTLPTGGTARFSSGLSAVDFLKRMSLVEYSPEALQRELPHITSIARREGLEAHARAAQWRFRK